MWESQVRGWNPTNHTRYKYTNAFIHHSVWITRNQPHLLLKTTNWWDEHTSYHIQKQQLSHNTQITECIIIRRTETLRNTSAAILEQKPVFGKPESPHTGQTWPRISETCWVLWCMWGKTGQTTKRQWKYKTSPTDFRTKVGMDLFTATIQTTSLL